MNQPDRHPAAHQLASLTGAYVSLHELGSSLLKYGWRSHPNGLEIGHRPWVAPENYALRLFSPASPEWIQGFETRYRREMPHVLRDFLRTTNGCMEYGLSLFGLAPSMQDTPASLNRSRVQPHDLGLASTDWASAYRPDPKHFHFGSRNLGWDDKLGYFMDENGRILGIKKSNGKPHQEWATILEFLTAELDAAEQEERSDPDSWWKD